MQRWPWRCRRASRPLAGANILQMNYLGSNVIERIECCSGNSGVALDSDLSYVIRPHENENIIHRFARNSIANSNITILRGQCKWEKSLFTEMYHVSRNRSQRNRTIG